MFRERLKELRGTMSQQDLAKALGVSRGAVGMWEATDRIPNYKILIRIANFFNVSTDYLLGNNKSIVMSEEKKQIVDFVLKQNVSTEQFELFKMNLQLNFDPTFDPTFFRKNKKRSTRKPEKSNFLVLHFGSPGLL